MMKMLVDREYGHSLGNNYFGPGRGRIWLHGLSCRGNETSLSNCSHSLWGLGAYHCSHSYDVSISCSNVSSIGNRWFSHIIRTCTAACKCFLHFRTLSHCRWVISTSRPGGKY